MKTIVLSILGMAFVGSAAYAQGAPNPAAEPAPPESPAASPAEPAASADQAETASSRSYTDEEIDNFAEATVKVQAIDADATIAAGQKQEKMAAAVAEAGLDPAKYNEIGKAAAADPDLRTKIQTAMARHASPPQG